MGLHRFDNKKELKKLDFKNNKAKYIKIGTISISFLVVIISIIYFTYSKFTLTDTFKTAEITVGDFIPADYILHYYVDGVAVTNGPSSGYYNVEITCDNGATGTWNEEDRSISISNATKSITKCDVKFITPPPEIITLSLDSAYTEQFYSFTLKANGDNIVWSASNLPDGLEIDSNTGIISGTPTSDSAGTYLIIVTATNNYGSDTKEISLSIGRYPDGGSTPTKP